jgi:flagellar biosynthesis/type III secretory pathway chaperone
MDATLCKDQLQRLITDENRLLGELEVLLNQEFGYLNENDIDALGRAGELRQTCMGALVRVEDERRSLCSMSGKTADLQGLEELLKWCDPRGSLQSHWTECAARATRCRDLNDRNGVVVTARMKRVEGMLNIITGRPQQPATYGPPGAYSAASSVGRMVRSEA